MSMPLSRASFITLFIGADSGLTMAIILAAETMFPNPMLISLIELKYKPSLKFS